MSQPKLFRSSRTTRVAGIVLVAVALFLTAFLTGRATNTHDVTMNSRARVTTSAARATNDCASDMISEKSDDGQMLAMLSGDTYRVAEADQSMSASWFPPQEVAVCDDGEGVYTIVNKDDNDRSVEAAKVTD